MLYQKQNTCKFTHTGLTSAFEASTKLLQNSDAFKVKFLDLVISSKS